MESPGPRFAQRFLAASLLLLVGCSTATTLKLRSGDEWEGVVVGGDDHAVYIQGRRRVEAIDRNDIVDIDYPGNVAATIGGILTLYGIANIVVGVNQCSKKGAAFCAGVVSPAILGLGLFGYGSVVYVWAVSATSKPPPSESPNLSLHLSLAPIYDASNQTIRPALSLGGRF